MERMTPDTTDFNSLSKKQLVELVIAKYNDCFRLEEENKKLKEDVEYFRQIYLDLKKLCEKEGFMLSDEEVTKMFNLDKIR